MSGGLDGVFAGLIQADKLFAVEAVADAAGVGLYCTICCIKEGCYFAGLCGAFQGRLPENGCLPISRFDVHMMPPSRLYSIMSFTAWASHAQQSGNSWRCSQPGLAKSWISWTLPPLPISKQAVSSQSLRLAKGINFLLG